MDVQVMGGGELRRCCCNQVLSWCAFRVGFLGPSSQRGGGHGLGFLPGASSLLTESLPPGETVSVVMGIDFCDSTQAASFQLW